MACLCCHGTASALETDPWRLWCLRRLRRCSPRACWRVPSRSKGRTQWPASVADRADRESSFHENRRSSEDAAQVRRALNSGWRADRSVKLHKDAPWDAPPCYGTETLSLDCMTRATILQAQLAILRNKKLRICHLREQNTEFFGDCLQRQRGLYPNLMRRRTAARCFVPGHHSSLYRALRHRKPGRGH